MHHTTTFSTSSSELEMKSEGWFINNPFFSTSQILQPNRVGGGNEEKKKIALVCRSEDRVIKIYDHRQRLLCFKKWKVDCGLVGKKSCENRWGLCTFPVYSIQKRHAQREPKEKWLLR